MNVKKALTIRASSIGDALMGKYLLENIRARYPDARLGLAVGSRGAMIQDLLRAYPWIEVVEANRRTVGGLWSLLKQFWRSDLVVTPYTGGLLNFSTKMFARLLARRGGLIGFVDSAAFNGYIYDVLLPHYGRAGTPRLHEVRTLSAAGIPVALERMTFNYLPQPLLLKRLGLQAKEYVVIGLFSGSDARGLSPQGKQHLIDALEPVLSEITPVFIGTAREREQLARLRLPANAVVADTTVQEAAALIDESRGMVSLGTGTSHIAASLRVPLVVLVNCQGLAWVSKDQWGDAPLWVFCNQAACPAGHDFTTYAACINSLDMQEVARAAKVFLNASVQASVAV